MCTIAPARSTNTRAVCRQMGWMSTPWGAGGSGQSLNWEAFPGSSVIFSLSSLLAQNHVRLQVRLNPGGSFLPACRGVLQNPRGECWGVIREAEVTARGGGLAFGFRTAYVLGQTNLKKLKLKSILTHTKVRLTILFCLLEMHRRAHNDRKIPRSQFTALELSHWYWSRRCASQTALPIWADTSADGPARLIWCAV